VFDDGFEEIVSLIVTDVNARYVVVKGAGIPET
jgi:hypothetical protein